MAHNALNQLLNTIFIMDTLKPYTYYATPTKIIDGDTVKVDLDLGIGIMQHSINVRLAGCNAPELKEAGGPEAKQALAKHLPLGVKVLLLSVHYDKYGHRIDADIFLIDHAGDQLPNGNLVDLLVADGAVVRWDGHGPRPVPAPVETPPTTNLPA